MKPISEKELIKARGKGQKIVAENGSLIKFDISEDEASELTDEQRFIKSLMEQLSMQQKDNILFMQQLTDAFKNHRIELEQAPPPEVKVQVEAAKSPEVIVQIDSPKEWHISVQRDHNGLIENLIAVRVK